jgi:hypothetical protein
MQTMNLTLPRLKVPRILYALAACVGWGVVCGVLRAPFLLVAIGGLAAAGLGFWLERAVLMGPETAQRKDFRLLVVAGLGFFAILGLGIVSLACLLSKWYLPRL